MSKKPLTAREIQVLDLVAAGLRHKEIGQRLGVTKHTVDHHLDHVKTKLGALTTAHAVVLRAGYKAVPVP